MHSAASSQPLSLQQLLGAFSSPRQINDNSIPGSPGIDIGIARPLLLPAPPPPQPSNPQHHMSSGTNAGTTHQPHYQYHAAPPIPRRFPRQAPYPILISPFLLACSEYPPSDTYATRTHKPNCNHYWPTRPHAPPTEATPHLPYTNLLISHKPIAVHTLALSKEEGEGGAHPPRPPLLPATHPPVLKPLNLDSSLSHSTQPLSQTPKLHYPSSSYR